MRQRKWLWLDLDAMVVELNNIMTLATAMYKRYDDFSHGWPHFEIYGTMRGRRQRKPAMLGLDAAMAGLIMAPVATAGRSGSQAAMDEGGRESLEVKREKIFFFNLDFISTVDVDRWIRVNMLVDMSEKIHTTWVVDIVISNH